MKSLIENILKQLNIIEFTSSELQQIADYAQQLADHKHAAEELQQAQYELAMTEVGSSEYDKKLDAVNHWKEQYEIAPKF